MKAKIVKRITEQDVIVTTKYGNIKASWEGIIPPNETVLNVDVRLNDSFEWGKNIILSQEEKYRIKYEDGIYINGKLELINHGYTVIRLGDSIITTKTKGNSPEVGKYIRLKARNILLFDIGL